MIELRIGRCDIRFSILFPAMVLFVTMLDTTGTAAQCLLASVIHELGHLTALFLCGAAPSAMVINVFGVRIEKRMDARLTYRQDVLVSMAGPAINLLSAVILYMCAGWVSAVWIHLVLGIFNLLPLEPLDGGQALLGVLRCCTTEERAARIVLYVSAITLLPMALVSVALLLYSGYNFTFLAVTAYVAALIFLKRK